MTDAPQRPPADSGERRPPTEHVLTSPPPTRAYAIAAGCAVLGAVLLVAGSSGGWPIGVVALGGVVLAFGIVLALAALILVRRSRASFAFDADGYRITGPGGTVTGRWDRTRQVTMSAGGHRIGLLGEPDRHVLSPAPASDPRARAMLADLKERLDADRGYRPLA